MSELNQVSAFAFEGVKFIKLVWCQRICMYLFSVCRVKNVYCEKSEKSGIFKRITHVLRRFSSFFGLSLLPPNFSGTASVPSPMFLETPLERASWNTCPAMSCWKRTPSSAALWWRRCPRNHITLSARRTNVRTRLVLTQRQRCRRDLAALNYPLNTLNRYLIWVLFNL